jgi:hypothetical protein
MAITPEPFDFGPWSVGDAITGPASVPYLDGDEPADFTGITLVDGQLVDPLGGLYPIVAVVDPLDGSRIAYTLSGDAFPLDGLYGLSAGVVTAGGTFRTAEAPFVVEARDGWATIAGVRAQWRDAPDHDVVLWRLLEVARTQVVTYARAVAVADAGPIPRPHPNLVLAQITQARNVWNAVKSDPGSQGIGDEGFVIRPFPMDWTVKNLIRPIAAVPVVR